MFSRKNTGLLFVILWAVLVILPSCFPLKKGASSDGIDTFYLLQNGKEKKVINDVLDVNKMSFELVFYNKKYDTKNSVFHAARLVASEKNDFFNQVKVGMSVSDVPYFLAGTGMAADESGRYHSLILDDASHHYLYYETPSNTRLNKHGNQGEYLKLGFEINSLYTDGKTVPLSDVNIKKLYVVLLVDRNLNGKIEKGELKKLKINLR